MPKATAPLDSSTPRKLKNPDHHGELGRKRVGVDHGRDRVGGIVETVDELKTERNQQGDKQEKIRQICRDLCSGSIDVDIDAVRHEQQTSSENAEEDDHGERIEALVEIGLGSRL